VRTGALSQRYLGKGTSLGLVSVRGSSNSREDYPEGRFTLALVGYGSEATGAVIELTCNWDTAAYNHGTGYGHIALAVSDTAAACAELAAQGVKIVRPAGPMTFASPNRSEVEVIAFIEDPDGYRIESIEHRNTNSKE
jgi:lactoylglutathione lyase